MSCHSYHDEFIFDKGKSGSNLNLQYFVKLILMTNQAGWTMRCSAASNDTLIAPPSIMRWRWSMVNGGVSIRGMCKLALAMKRKK